MAVVGFEENLFKVLVVGDSGAGKTSLIRRFVHNVFQITMKATIGVDFALKVMHVLDQALTMQVWDIAGQEQFGSMTRVYYQGAVGALVTFDISRPHTFENAAKWKKDIDEKVFLPDGSPIPCLLVANKSDLNPNPISDAQMNAFCQKHNFIGWVETSCKTNLNVRVPFERLAERVLENARGGVLPEEAEEADRGTIRIGDDKEKRSLKQRCGC